MSKISEKEWMEEFQAFVKSKGVPVPESLSKSILLRVHADLCPSPWQVFVKLLGVQGVVGTFSLLICNQFGMSPFHTEFSLSDYFMKFGHSACMFLCGVLFVGLGVVIGRAILSIEEFAVLRRNVALQIFGLSALSLGVFAAVGAEIALTIGLLWLLGAMLAGVSLTLFAFSGHRVRRA